MLGDYSIFRIYRVSTAAGRVALNAPTFAFGDADPLVLAQSEDAWIRAQRVYLGQGSHAFACTSGDAIVGLCFFWLADRYNRDRNFWTLCGGEAKLVQVVTRADMRGRGVATGLIAHATAQMLSVGFDRIYARIWHSNTPSLRAFQRAGWRQIATVIEINPLRRRRPWRLTLDTRERPPRVAIPLPGAVLPAPRVGVD